MPGYDQTPRTIPEESDRIQKAGLPRFLQYPVRKLHGFEKWAFILRNIIPTKIGQYKGGKYFIKGNCHTRLTEAVSSEFVATHTTIPVPHIHDVFQVGDTVYIVQEFIDAPMLLHVWMSLSQEDRERCMAQLKGYMDQLRELIPPEPGRVQSVNGDDLSDQRMGYRRWGPFDSHDEFNKFFGHDEVREEPNKFPGGEEAKTALARTKDRHWRTVFSHGDLGPHNILWDVKKREIASIIDWEYSGWFPEYWDYTRPRFHYTTSSPTFGWWKMFQDHVDCYPEELEIERYMSGWYGRNF